MTPEASRVEEEEEPVKVECDEASAEEIESEDEEEPEDEVEEEDAIVEVTRRPRAGFRSRRSGPRGARAAPRTPRARCYACVGWGVHRGRGTAAARLPPRPHYERARRGRHDHGCHASATATSRSTKKVPAGVCSMALRRTVTFFVRRRHRRRGRVVRLLWLTLNFNLTNEYGPFVDLILPSASGPTFLSF